MIVDYLVWSMFLLSAVPFAMTVWNLFQYRHPPEPTPNANARRVSILIPARNEEHGIRESLETALQTRGVDFEIVVLDDHSNDRTAYIVQEIAAIDARIRLESAPSLPAGWCGKQHACFALASLARHDVFVFIDADVRLKPDAVARAVAFLDQSRAALVSGVPHQQTETFGEKLLIPLIYFVLLGYLPIWRMRRCGEVAYAAGCGQLFVTHRSDYEAIGGHSGLRDSLHDGVKLPRLYREHGRRTDMFDATSIATCRMYDSTSAVWDGLGKNATEGLAGPIAVWIWSVLLWGGHIAPFLGLMVFPWLSASQRLLMIGACVLSLITRALMTIRFRQSWLGTLLHPLGMAALLVIQWTAWCRSRLGRPLQWRGRSYCPQKPVNSP
ncbi:glycosyltransferase [Thalassoroseus pseudoceratinae]|uniref:glycosyltransferase n=1 Tax=Thalassoroseus pseudoceratinae TaxID=2713176 RepID=UPI0019822087|nr:glycosyltransferase family 2 protein [Thalassoroseus pseudoceratinae]